MLSTTSADADIATTLTTQFYQLLPAFDGMFASEGDISQHMDTDTRTLLVDAGVTHPPPTQLASAHAPLVAAMLAQIVSIAQWHYAPHPSNATVTAAPIRYHGYGSGPRENWQ
jgi:hypothetical protein